MDGQESTGPRQRLGVETDCGVATARAAELREDHQAAAEGGGMIGTRQIRVGAIFRIAINGESHECRITDMKDGRVIVGNAKIKTGRGRWWLPIASVKRDGQLLKPYRFPVAILLSPYRFV